MALSFSRPDPSSPAEVSSANFTVARRGFDQAEVRDLLRMVAAEMARLQEREKFLERELRGAQRQSPNAAVVLDDEVVTRMLGEEAARILQTAREAASQIKIRAEDGSARLLREATDEAQRMREEASVEASRRRQDASADAESELQMAKQQGREMVNEARAYRERVLSELARRRELARQQIEQLVHGRDRLLQAFERARLAAVDVMAEMTPLGEPTEYVNLSPTTGPVPVMVPADVLRIVPPAPAAREEVAEVTVDEADDDSNEVAVEADAIEDIAIDDIAIDDIAVDDIAVDDIAVDESDDIDTDTLAASADDDVITDDSADNPSDDDGDASHGRVVPLFGGSRDTAGGETTDHQAATDSGDAATSATVDDLFARLRAARADSVAQRVLAAAEDHPVSQRVAEPDDAAAPARGAATVVSDLRVIGDDPAVFQPSAAAPHHVDEFDEDTPFGRRDAALTPLIVSTARKLKRALADEQNDVLATLRRSEPVRALDTLLPWATDQTQRYAGAITDDLQHAARAGAASVAATGPAAAKAERAETLQPAVDLLTDGLLTPLRDRVDRAIGQAGGQNSDLAESVRAIYREWKLQRIDEHVEHIVHMAFGRGAFAGLASGTPICWSVDPDGPSCADADDNSLAGVIAAGEPFPTGNLCAPAHAGCRCMLTPSP